MKIRLAAIYIISFLLYSQSALCQYRYKDWNWNSAAYGKYVFESSYGKMPYRLLTPPNPILNKKYPLVVILHGKGEGLGQKCSIDHGSNECNLLWGGKMHLDSINKYPGYVLFPQTEGGDWITDNYVKLLLGILESMTKTYNIDLDRIYIHGLSAGANGVWNLVNVYPHLFAAISPMSHSGDITFASKLKYSPIWTVQGEFDLNPRPEQSVEFIDALRDMGAYAYFTRNESTNTQEWSPQNLTNRNPIYTVIPNENHVAWPYLYDSPTWLNWMYSQNKNRIVVLGRTTIAPGEAIKLGISSGFDGYEWSNGATSNEIIVRNSGTFRVRYKRKANLISGPLVWSAWSAPITITASPSIQVVADAGRDVKVQLPKTTTKLRAYGEGAGVTYKWTKVSGGVVTLTETTTHTLTLTNLQLGTYTFRVTVTDNQGRSAIDDVTVTVGVDAVKRSVTSFQLINADNNTVIRELKNGDVISLSSMPTQNIGIRAITNPTIVGSVFFILDKEYRAKNIYPYEWNGMFEGVFYKGSLPVGIHTLTGTPYQGLDASGNAGTALTVKFTVVQSGGAKLAADEAVLDMPLSAEDSTIIALYPNPIDDRVNINFVAQQKNVKYYLYDNTGYMIQSGDINMFSTSGELYLSGLQPGVYQLRISSDKIPSKTIQIYKK